MLIELTMQKNRQLTIFVFPILASPPPTLFIFTKEDKTVYGFPMNSLDFLKRWMHSSHRCFALHKLIHPPHSYHWS